MTYGYAALKCLSALYWMSQYSESDWAHVAHTLGKTKEKLIAPKLKDLDGRQADILESMLTTIDWMLDSYKEIPFNKEDLIARVRLDKMETEAYVSEFEGMLNAEVNEDTIHDRMRALRSELEHQLTKHRVEEEVRKLHREVTFNSGGKGYGEILEKFKSEIESIRGNQDGNIKGLVGSIGSSSVEAIRETLQRAQDMNTERGVIRTPYKGLNRACGYGGLRRGEFANFGALSHHNKTGVIMDCFRGALMYNKPYMVDSKKKPLVIHISFENRLEQNLPMLYKDLYEAEFQVKVDKSKINPSEAAEYIMERFKRNGYEFRMECFEANDFSPVDIITILEGYRAKGYEIHLVACDYLELICDKTGASMRADEAILHGLDTVRSYTMTKAITFVNGHQLSSEAQSIFKDYRTGGFVNEINNAGMYRNTKGLHQKLDLEFVQAVIKTEFGAFMEFARGKHRGGEDTPFSHLIFAKQFREFGGMLDDVELEEVDIIPNLRAHIGNLISGGSGGGQSGGGDIGQNQYQPQQEMEEEFDF